MPSTRAPVVIGKLEKAAIGRILQRHQTNSGIGKSVIMLVLDILQKVLNDRRGDEKAGIFQARHSLESDADHAIVLNDRTAAVARIDGGIGLASQRGAGSRCAHRFPVSIRDTTPRV